MNNKHYDNLVTIAEDIGIYHCAMSLLSEMGCLIQCIVNELGMDATGGLLKNDNRITEMLAWAYNALDEFCIACDIEDTVQDEAEKAAEDIILRMMQNAE